MVEEGRSRILNFRNSKFILSQLIKSLGVDKEGSIIFMEHYKFLFYKNDYLFAKPQYFKIFLILNLELFLNTKGVT